MGEKLKNRETKDEISPERKAKMEEIFENEERIIKAALEQKNMAQKWMGAYRLPTGQYVIDKTNSHGGEVVLSNTDKYMDRQNREEENGPIVKAYFDEDRNCTKIEYLFFDEGKEILSAFIQKENNAVLFKNSSALLGGISEDTKADSFIDVIDNAEAITGGKELIDDNVRKFIIGDFKKLVWPFLDKDKIIEELRGKVEVLENENEEIKKENDELTTELAEQRKKNKELEEENLDVKERFVKVRKFITERCAKIPFVGKRLLREMQTELGEKELPKGKREEER